MRKPFRLILYIASIICISLTGFWLVSVIIYLVGTGATYSYGVQSDNGGQIMLCDIPIFTSENWLWRLLQLFGAPALVLFASVQTVRYLYKGRG